MNTGPNSRQRGWKRCWLRGLRQQLSHPSEHTSFTKVTLTISPKKVSTSNNGYNGYPILTVKKSNRSTSKKYVKKKRKSETFKQLKVLLNALAH